MFRICHRVSSGFVALFCATALTFSAPTAFAIDALEPRDYAVELSALVQASPPEIRIRWRPDPNAGEHQVYRKAKESWVWSPIITLPGSATEYADRNVLANTGYEYQVVTVKAFDPYPNGSPQEWVRAFGYLYAAIDLGATLSRGAVILVVESSVAGSMASELGQYQSDLVGDGWKVHRIDVSRTELPTAVRDKIRAIYNSDPSNTKAVFLFGHVPVPYSGEIAPDLHESHRGAWPADVFYGEMNGSWTDNSVSRTDTEDARNINLPGDGKFDQSEIPGEVELAVGRVDFSDLPTLGAEGLSEVDMLRRYLQKNHRYRHKLFSLPQRGLLRDNFGITDGDAPAATAWRAFSALVGSENVAIAPSDQYFSYLRSNGCVWSFGAGGGTWDHADGIGWTPEFFRQDPKTVFAILHGSYFGDWDGPDNFLRGALAAPTYTLAAIWAGLPHWYFHHMALGETLGFATKIAQNNRMTYRSEVNLSVGQVHIGLIGDPTLRAHITAPPQNVRGSVSDSVTLAWDAPNEEILGYHVFRSASPMGPFTQLNRATLTGTSYTDSSYSGGKQFYMVRAVRVERTPSGTYYNPSQGVFWNTDGPSEPILSSVTILAADAEASEEGPNPGKLVISRTPPLSAPLDVAISLSGTASNGADFVSLQPLHRIEAGQATVEIDVVPLSDSLAEVAEQLTVTIAARGGYRIGSPGAATVTIANHTPPATLIKSVEIRATGARLLSFSTEPASRCAVEASSDLKAWTKLGDSVADASGNGQFTDSTPFNGAARFYRIVRNN